MKMFDIEGMMEFDNVACITAYVNELQ